MFLRKHHHRIFLFFDHTPHQTHATAPEFYRFRPSPHSTPPPPSPSRCFAKTKVCVFFTGVTNFGTQVRARQSPDRPPVVTPVPSPFRTLHTVNSTKITDQERRAASRVRAPKRWEASAVGRSGDRERHVQDLAAEEVKGSVLAAPFFHVYVHFCHET